MNRVEKAVLLFRAGHACSQAILAVYGPTLGLDETLALKIACPFGGGMARMGGTCGAVTGAFMVIGLKHGRVSATDEQAKEKTYEIVREFVERFTSRNGSMVCRELLGYDLGDAQARQTATEEGLFDTLCPNLVRDAAEILEEVLG